MESENKIYIIENRDCDDSHIVGYHTDKNIAMSYCECLDKLAEESGRFLGECYYITEVNNLCDIDYLDTIMSENKQESKPEQLTIFDCVDDDIYTDDIEVNSNGVNKKIKANILSDDAMIGVGFRCIKNEYWYLYKQLDFGISFNVAIPKDGSDIRIDVLDEDFCQPYDYQRMLSKNPQFNKTANIIKNEVEDWMEFLTNAGIISGWERGMYI